MVQAIVNNVCNMQWKIDVTPETTLLEVLENVAGAVNEKPQGVSVPVVSADNIMVFFRPKLDSHATVKFAVTRPTQNDEDEMIDGGRKLFCSIERLSSITLANVGIDLQKIGSNDNPTGGRFSVIFRAAN